VTSPRRFQVADRLYGGPYPDEIPPDVDFVLDLTEDGELEPYPCVCQRRRMPIRDFSVPTEEELERILNTIDDALAYGRTVFVHCRGGIGRTGTVLGCWLRRHGSSADDAFAALGGRPETDEQRALIRSWHE
jgi:protein-tyrosine phosphatase